MWCIYTGTWTHERTYRGQKRMLFALVHQSLLHYFKTGLLSEPGVGWRPGSPMDCPASPNTVLALQGCRDTQRLLQECWIWTQVLIPAQQEELLSLSSLLDLVLIILMIEKTFWGGVGVLWATMHCLFEIKLSGLYLRRPVKKWLCIVTIASICKLEFCKLNLLSV